VLAGGDLSAGPALACDVVVCGSIRRGQALRRDTAQAGDGLFVSGPLGGPAAKRYPPRLFVPRVNYGRRLIGSASSCIDITDGLALDLHRLCVASRVSARLEEIPLVAGATVEHALSGGDEYELLFTAPAASKVGIPIGRIEPGEPGAIRYRDVLIEPVGHDHFRSPH
jgi:thiamine-monophosphate kinase